MSDIIQETASEGVAITKLNLQGTLPKDFSMKTLYQEKQKTLAAKKVMAFVNSFAKASTFINGKYIEGKIQYLPRGTNFKSNNFIPGQENVGKNDTSIRRNVDKLWVPTRMVMPEARDENIYQNRLDYRIDAYVQKLITGEAFINDSFGTLLEAIEYIQANRCIFGHDYIDDIDGVDVGNVKILHAPGLKDLIANAKADVVTDVSKIDMTSSTGQRNVQYVNMATTTSSSLHEAASQLNTLIEYMMQPNACFAHTPGIKQSAQEIVLLATTPTIKALHSCDLNYFKSLKEVLNASNLVEIPKTTIDLEYSESNSVSNPVGDIADVVGSLGLSDGEIFIIEKDTIERFTNLTVGKLENMFQNNITISHFVQASLGTDLTPDKAYAVFSAPVFVGQFANPVTDVTKATK